MANYSRNAAQLHAKYDIRETLGSGAFSEVKRAICRKTNQSFAIKIIDRKKCIGKENMIHSEIEILKRVKHENIIQLFELFETEDKIYLVMQLVSGGELFDSIVARGHYTEIDAAQIIEKILLAVDYIHSLGIAHRDLKPENLLFHSKSKDSKIMISDFGLSKIFNDEDMMKTACGTPGYVAPEVLRRQGYGPQVDLWSIGVISYILLCGYPPFYSENNQELFQQIMRGEYEFDSPHWDDISEDAKHFISRLLVVDPNRRYNTEKALSHRFIRKNCPKKYSALPFNSTAFKMPWELATNAAAAYHSAINSSSIANNTRNLASKVSQNLKTRRVSDARRRSVDVKTPINQASQPHPPPPAPGSRRPSVDPRFTPISEDSDSTLKPKNQQSDLDDSGVVFTSAKTSLDGDLNESDSSASSSNSSDTEFSALLRQLSLINNMLENGKIDSAEQQLNQLDCPHSQTITKLYLDVILAGKRNTSSGSRKSSIQKDSHSAEMKSARDSPKLNLSPVTSGKSTGTSTPTPAKISAMFYNPFRSVNNRS